MLPTLTAFKTRVDRKLVDTHVPIPHEDLWDVSIHVRASEGREFGKNLERMFLSGG